MRILFLTSEFPYPPLAGAPLRNYGLIGGLAAHEIWLLSFASPYASEADQTPLRDRCAQVKTVPRPNRSILTRLRERIPDAVMRVLEPSRDPGWVGYVLFSDSGGREGSAGARALVLANPSGRTVHVHARDASLGVDWQGALEPCGHRVIELGPRAAR